MQISGALLILGIFFKQRYRGRNRPKDARQCEREETVELAQSTIVSKLS